MLYALARRRRRGARLGSRGGVVERALDGRRRSAARRGSSSATATSACTSLRSELLQQGAPLSAVTERLAEGFGLRLHAAPGDRRSASDLRRDAGRHLPVSGVVRRARASRRGRRPPLHGRRGGATRARSARGDRERRPDRDRSEQPVRLDLADPGRRRDSRRGRAAHRPLRRRQPADRRAGGQGARRQDARAARAAAPARPPWPAATRV